MNPCFLTPNWPVPANVKACSTVRFFEADAAFSDGQYAGLNLGDHVGDDAEQVIKNRQWLAEDLMLPQPPT